MGKITHAVKFFLDPVVFAVAITAILFYGCTKKIYMPTETRIESHVETADTTQSVRVAELIDQLQSAVRTQEKVVVRDSVIYVVNEVGTVVSKEVYHSGDRDYAESEVAQRVTHIYDSLFQRQTAMVDSVLSTFKQEPVIIEKETSVWRRIKDGLVGALLIAVFVGFFYGLRWLKSKYFH